MAVFAMSSADARAGVEAWVVNEVASEPRFVELYAPPSPLADNCFFPTTVVEVFDGAGVVKGTVQPFSSTKCFPGDYYFVFAAEGGDVALPVALDPAAGQVCLRSSNVRYDCVRWGAVTVAVGDQESPDDATAAPAIAAGQAVARVDTTGVVATDFELRAPTPRGPNDGTPWFPPDAGPPADAAAPPDAEGPSDAMDPDGPPRPDHPDARVEPPDFLFAEPGGGGCSVGGHGGGGAGLSALVLLVSVALAQRRRRVGVA